jgi:hypothetical protein
VRVAEEAPLPRITKDCFGTVISSLKKMKECVRCEFLRECRAVNWEGEEAATPPLVMRRPIPPVAAEDDVTRRGTG